MTNSKTTLGKVGKTSGLSLSRPSAALRQNMPSEEEWLGNRSKSDASMSQGARDVPAPAAKHSLAPVPPAVETSAPPISAPAKVKEPKAKAKPPTKQEAEEAPVDELPRFTLGVEKEMFQKFSIFCVRAGVKKMHFFRDYLIRVRDDKTLAARIIAIAKSNPQPTPQSVKRISIDLSTGDKNYLSELCINAEVTMADFWRTVIAESASTVKD